MHSLIKSAVLLPRFKHKSNVNYRYFFDKVDRNWETAWQKDVTPWETGATTKPLKYALESEELLQTILYKKDSYALVPGCGSGYDVNYLGTMKYDTNGDKLLFENVVGLDLSPTAIELCIKNLEQYRKQNEQLKLSNITYIDTDFFKYEHIVKLRPQGLDNLMVEQDRYENIRFDFIFDYLFFAALDPGPADGINGNTLRELWGKSMSRLLKSSTDQKINGILATLMFPYSDRNSNDNTQYTHKKVSGPPYPVCLQDYEDILLPLGFRLIKQAPVPLENSIKPRAGREVMGYWKLMDTNQ